MPGFDSVACGCSVLGSGAGEGTSSCGCCSACGGSVCFGRSAQRAPRKTTSNTASRLITSFAAGLPPGRREPAPPTPGMAGISDLKRSDEGCSAISFVPILYSNHSELTTTCPHWTAGADRFSDDFGSLLSYRATLPPHYSPMKYRSGMLSSHAALKKKERTASGPPILHGELRLRAGLCAPRHHAVQCSGNRPRNFLAACFRFAGFLL